MKKRILILLITLLFVISPIFARPQFFFGGGVEWGKLYPGVNEKEELSHNKTFDVSADGAYISHLTKKLSDGPKKI